MNYDIIGDIHGHADELEILLKILGYRKQGGAYEHYDKRKVIFLGDFIDRGPKIRQALHMVRNMVDTGNAEAIMGNHEFNAIAYHTPTDDNGKNFLRPHNNKNITQHLATLDQFKKFDSEWLDFLDWFKTLNLYIDKKEFRAVHACWDSNHINWLEANFNGFNNTFLKEATTKNSKAYIVIEELLKGKEQKLHDGHFFFDKDGNRREECRLKWWQPLNQRSTYGDIMMTCPVEIKDLSISENNHYHYPDNKPVFFGHYWLKGQPTIENKKAICLDYSVAKGGILTAYRTDFLNENNPENGFIFK